MALCVRSTTGATPTIVALEMLPGAVSSHRSFRIHEEYGGRTSTIPGESSVGVPTRPASFYLYCARRDSSPRDKSAKGPATFTVQCLMPSPFHVDLCLHQRLPPNRPLVQSSPSLYSSSQGLSSSPSRRRSCVAGPDFSQTMIDSGTSVSASTRMSECVVTKT